MIFIHLFSFYLAFNVIAGDECGRRPILEQQWGNDLFIVGGAEAVPNSWPWQVSIFMSIFGSEPDQFCGASLINDQWIVTAAHCFDYRFDFSVGLGYHDLTGETKYQKFIEIDNYFVHEEYDRNWSYDNDIALIKLPEKINFTTGVQPVCLPDAKQTYEAGQPFIVTGWGYEKYGGKTQQKLQQVLVPYIDIDKCEEYYPFGFSRKSTFCAGYDEGGRDACQGDSGGPIVTEIDGKWILGGVVSWGKGCAGAKQPGVYTDITKFLDWINDKVENN